MSRTPNETRLGVSNNERSADLHEAAAYGGAGWSPRTTTLRDEIGQTWANCGIANEWSPLEAVLLHRPDVELNAVGDPDRWQMLDPLDLARAQRQHDRMARSLAQAGVDIHYVVPNETPPPNLLFVADLMLMTPEGAIVGRPASAVRAGEERFVAWRLADLGIPVLRTVRGAGVFEGADAAWIDPQTVLLATGLRTNNEGAAQVTATLQELGVEVIRVGLPYGAMHLMGVLRFADRDLAIAWPGRVPFGAVEALRSRGFTVLFLPDVSAAERRIALNFVTLGPRQILMAAGHGASQAFLEQAGIICETAEIDELAKAAGGIACMTGILARQRPAEPAGETKPVSAQHTLGAER